MENPSEADGLQELIDREAAILRAAGHDIGVRPGNANIDYDIDEDDSVTTLERKGVDEESLASEEESHDNMYED